MMSYNLDTSSSQPHYGLDVPHLQSFLPHHGSSDDGIWDKLLELEGFHGMDSIWNKGKSKRKSSFLLFSIIQLK
jgi:hypothetical protein